MVKLTGPMFSLTASGKLGKVLVYSIWKGVQYGRMLITPTQPRPAAVMNVRIKMKALGKVSKPFTSTSSLLVAIKLVIPAGKGWAGYWIGVAIKQFIVDNTAWDTIDAEFAGLADVVRNAWVTEAEDLGLAHQTLTVEGMSADHPATFEKHLAVYLLAKVCWYLEVLDAGDVAYTNPSGWDAAAVATFGARILD